MISRGRGGTSWSSSSPSWLGDDTIYLIFVFAPCFFCVQLIILILGTVISFTDAPGCPDRIKVFAQVCIILCWTAPVWGIVIFKVMTSSLGLSPLDRRHISDCVCCYLCCRDGDREEHHAELEEQQVQAEVPAGVHHAAPANIPSSGGQAAGPTIKAVTDDQGLERQQV